MIIINSLNESLQNNSMQHGGHERKLLAEKSEVRIFSLPRDFKIVSFGVFIFLKTQMSFNVDLFTFSKTKISFCIEIAPKFEKLGNLRT